MQHAGRRLGWVGIGALLFAGSTALARNDAVPALELDVFRWINSWPDWLALPLWPFMQFGMLLATFAAAGIAYYLRRRRGPAVALALGGTVVWLLAKVVKEFVGRPRPGGLIEGVSYRVDGGPDGIGFISGHAALAFFIVVIALPYVARGWAVLLFGLALLAGALRIYVGAHFPLDIVGGAGFGIILGAVVGGFVRD